MADFAGDPILNEEDRLGRFPIEVAFILDEDTHAPTIKIEDINSRGAFLLDVESALYLATGIGRMASIAETLEAVMLTFDKYSSSKEEQGKFLVDCLGKLFKDA